MSQSAGADSARRRTRLVRRVSAGLVTGAVALSGGLAAAVLGHDAANGVNVSDSSATTTSSDSGSDSGSTDSQSSDTPVQLSPGSGDDHATTSGS